MILHNPVLAYENGDEFVRAFDDAATGRLDPFVLVLEGSVPNEEINGEGHWAGMGNDPQTRPADPDQHVDRPARPQGRRGAGAGDVRRLRRDPGHAQQPDRGDGAARLPRLELDVPRSGSRSSTCPAARSSRTTSPRRCSTSCCTSLGMGPRSTSTSRAGRPRSSAAPSTRAATAPGWPRSASSPSGHGDGQCLVKLGCKGPVVKCNVPSPRVDQRDRRLPQRGRDLHGVHDARLPGQVHAVRASPTSPPGCTPARPRLAHGPVAKYLRDRRIRRTLDVEP